jgi:hypothetical protein
MVLLETSLFDERGESANVMCGQTQFVRVPCADSGTTLPTSLGTIYHTHAVTIAD